MVNSAKEKATQYFKDLGNILRSEPDRQKRKEFLDAERRGAIFPEAFEVLRKDVPEKRQDCITGTESAEKHDNLPYLAFKGENIVWSNQHLNEEAFVQEESRFKSMVNSSERMSASPPPVIPNPDYSRYNRSNMEYIEGVAFVNAINQRMESGESPELIDEFDVLSVGVKLLMHDNLRRRIKILEERAEKNAGPAIRLMRLLTFDIGDVMLKIDGVSLKDFEDEKKWKNSPSAFLHFLIRAGVMCRRDEDYEVILRDNPGEIESLFPNLLIEKGRHFVRYAVHAAQAHPELLSRMGGSLHGVGKKGAEVGVRLVENIQSFKEFAYKNILNSSSGKSEEIMKVIEQYINGQEDEKIYALLTLGLVDIRKTRSLHRLLFRAIDEGRASDAHKSLFSAIDILISKYPSTEDLPTYEDAQSIFDQTTSIDEAIPSMSDIGKKVGAIFSIASEKYYSLDSEKIPWSDALALPQDIRVVFGDRPKKFTVELDYENEIGEKINVDMQIDCDKQTFDWSFLENPDDKRMEKLHDVLILTVGSIIDVIQKKTALELEEKRKITASQFAVVRRPSVAKKNHEREIRPEKSEKRKHEERVSAAVTPIMRAFQELQDTGKLGMPKNHIILPASDVLNELLKEIGTYDHEKVLGAIDRYNTQGGAVFFQLDTKGEPRYELKIGSKGVPKGIRVILVPSRKESLERGVRHFEVYGIWYRGESFKRHRRKKLDN